MSIGAIELGGVFILNGILGALLVLAVFVVMERQFAVGAFGGIGLGGVVIYAQATYGEQLLTVTVQGMKLLVLAAAMGAVLGVVTTVMAIEPEL
ncbi:hypothetical protein [Halobellus salinisoli]|uniref:hypothetical protein n=1 Tax=Halobellus salinisoli TaxID=3108500 RepID=UPI003009F62F